MIGSLRECHFITVLDDDMCVLPLEHFFADLALVSGRRGDINFDTAQIFIDDSGEEECGKLKHTLLSRNGMEIATTL